MQCEFSEDRIGYLGIRMGNPPKTYILMRYVSF